MRVLGALLSAALAVGPVPAQAGVAVGAAVRSGPAAALPPVVFAPSAAAGVAAGPSLALPLLSPALPVPSAPAAFQRPLTVQAAAAAVIPSAAAVSPAAALPALSAAAPLARLEGPRLASVPAAVLPAAAAAAKAPVLGAARSAARSPAALPAVFDGGLRRRAEFDPVVPEAPAPSRPRGLGPSAARSLPAVALPAGLAFLAPALPYAAGVGILGGTWLAIRGVNRLLGAVARWKAWDPAVVVVARLGSELALWAVGGSAALRVMGLDWSTVFASLGLGGLAVTLATREFLGNFMRGVVFMADSPIRIGDRVIIEGRTLKAVDMTFRYVVLAEDDSEFTLLTYSTLATAPFTVLPRLPGDAGLGARGTFSDLLAPARGRGPLFWVGLSAAAAAVFGLGVVIPAAQPYLFAAALLGATALLERLAIRCLDATAGKRGWSPTGTAVSRLGVTLGFYAVGLLAALRVAGAPWSALLTGAGVLGVAISVAASDIISNLMQAVWLLLARPFRVGDSVRIGAVEGKVVDMTLRYVVLEASVAGETHSIYVPYSAVAAGPLRVHREYPWGRKR